MDGRGDFHPVVIAQGKSTVLWAEKAQTELKKGKVPQRKDQGPNPIKETRIKVKH